ncbi:DUF6543 domain-containing protein [Pseudomonas sp. RIT-PI-S]|uniref:dermonecrotic toxin domain-containing protein n=1 Tax=Pseudomonas sp. RIT-PI-S TaxID=3035295 RepID=UPI0021D845CF|nr:DUF6543 domain-containing protein [Pseudomonas sp. RIT-PI-S]
MPTPSLPFFHASVLQQQFLDSLRQQAQAGSISALEQQALTTLVARRPEPMLGRYDCFVAPSGKALDARLHGALVLALPNASAVYLFSPLSGLRRYANHQQLTQALRAAGIDTDGLALELLQQQAFSALAEHYLHHRGSGLAQAADALALLPVFDTQLRAAASEPEAAVLAALDAFWETGPAGYPRRALLAQAYRGGFYQALLSARYCSPPAWTAALLQADPQATHLYWQRLLVQEDDQLVPFAGALVWSLPGRSERCLFMPERGLGWYRSEQSLLQAEALQPLAPWALPSTSRVRWHQAPARHLVLEPLQAEPFSNAIEQIRAAQSSDVYDALLRTQGLPVEQVMVPLENALDIRRRLDYRLLALDPTARWIDQRVTQASAEPDPTDIPEKEGEVIALLGQVRDSRSDISLAQPDVEQVIESLLTPWLAVFDPALTSEQVSIGLDREHVHHRFSLSDLLLECVTGRQTAELPETATVQVEGQGELAGLDAASVAFCLGQAVPAFNDRYLAQVDHLYHYGVRVNDLWVSARAVMQRTLEWVLRADLTLAARESWLPTSTLGLLQAALDDSASVEAFGIDLEFIKEGTSVRLADVAVLRLKPALSAPHSGDSAVLFWSAALGLQTAPSLDALGERLVEWLSQPGPDNRYLGLLPRVDHALLRVLYDQHTSLALNIAYWPMDGNLLHRLHKSAHGRRLQQTIQVQQLLRQGRFGAPLCRVLLDGVAIDDSLAQAFSRLAQGWVDQQAETVLPGWLLAATPQDQHTFIQYLRDCAQVASPTQDYLEGLPSLEHFANQEVRQRLADDGFGPALDPDRVRIVSRAYIPAPVAIGNLPSAIPAAVSEHEQSLSEAALQPSAWLRETLLLSRDDGGELPAGLTPLYVRSLVRSLDCGGHYRRLLEGTLGRDSPSFVERRARFTQQMRRQMLVTAFALKLQGVLGAVAFAMIEQVAQAPDDQARRDAGLPGVTLSLLELRAGPGLGLDPCEGVYVLQAPASNGPVVMFMLYARQAAFVEYPRDELFQRALRTDDSLQAALLERIDPVRRPIYADGGLARPHLNRFFPEAFTDLISTVAPAEWVTTPVTGNAFHRLYEDNLDLLRSMARAQTISAEEARWQDLRYLVGLAVEQGSMFLPIPVAAVIGLWQSRQLAGAALAAARNRKWGQALSEMVAAMVNLLSVAAPGPHAGTPPHALAWGPGGQLPSTLRRRLAAMEVTDQALAQLMPVADLPLYRQGNQHYASVEGKVFQVAQQAGQWRILDRDQQWGPSIHLGPNNRWQLELNLRGGGPVASRYRRERVVDSFKDQFVVTERGLREIRRFKPSLAAQLEGSLIDAQRILHRAERKLAMPERISPATRAVLEDTFGPGEATPLLVKRLHSLIEELYAEAVTTSLRDGERWVLCTATPGNELNVAFIVNTDPKRRIFLSDTFFDPSVVTSVSPSALQAGFDPLRYLQSTVLIHELSHWSLKTDDFTYLGLSTPYFDLVDPAVWQSDRVQIEADRRGLAFDTPASRLFGFLSGEQLGSADRSTLRHLLALTRQKDLPGAIAMYQANPSVRNDVILSNADSLTWLALQLGREPSNTVMETAV